jgi:hypothetical protein
MFEFTSFARDAPLSELILAEKGQKQIDRLWDEFDVIADYTARTQVQYFFTKRRGGRQGRRVRLGAPAGSRAA